METEAFTNALKDKGDAKILENVQEKILENPETGKVMPGCGGVRKVRIGDPSRNKGTRGGLRVLFLDLPHREVPYLIYAYGKNETENISSEGKKKIREFAAALRKEK